MPKFKCHKVVTAHQIAYVEEKPEGLMLGFEGGQPMRLAGPDMTKRYTPEYGDYFVIYEDGYQSISPKKAFEEGYSEIVEGVDTIPDRITPEMLEAVIVGEVYQTEQLMTVCILTTKNGFQVVGQAACANPDIYDEEKGREFAREDAVKKLWPLEGYLLKQRLYEAK